MPAYNQGMAKRPPIATNPAIPIPVQRDLRTVAQYAFDAQDRADKALAGLKTKLGRNPQDLLEISTAVSQDIQANGRTPTNLTGLPLGPSGVKAGTYTIAGTKITVNSSGIITDIS